MQGAYDKQIADALSVIAVELRDIKVLLQAIATSLPVQAQSETRPRP